MTRTQRRRLAKVFRAVHAMSRRFEFVVAGVDYDRPNTNWYRVHGCTQTGNVVRHLTWYVEVKP